MCHLISNSIARNVRGKAPAEVWFTGKLVSKRETGADGCCDGAGHWCDRLDNSVSVAGAPAYLKDKDCPASNQGIADYHPVICVSCSCNFLVVGLNW